MKPAVLIQLACASVFLACSVVANGQGYQCGDAGCLYFASTVTVTQYSVHLYTYAEVDNTTADYYDLTSQTWFYQDYTQINYQSVTTTGNFTANFYTTPSPGHWYQGGTEETLTAYYEEYVYSTSITITNGSGMTHFPMTCSKTPTRRPKILFSMMKSGPRVTINSSLRA